MWGPSPSVINSKANIQCIFLYHHDLDVSECSCHLSIDLEFNWQHFRNLSAVVHKIMEHLITEGILHVHKSGISPSHRQDN